eukprot:jgi/Psemu1/21655/gm1.21655_g
MFTSKCTDAGARTSMGTGNNDNKCNIQPMVGGKPSLVRNMQLAPKNWTQTQPLSKNGNSNKSKQNVELLNYILDVNVPKSPLIGGRGYAMHYVEVMFKDPDPEILYPTYKLPIYTISAGLVQFYGEESGKDEAGESGNKVKGRSGKAQCNNKGRNSSDSSSASTPLSGNASSNSFSDSNISDHKKNLEYNLEDGYTEGDDGHLVLTLLDRCKQTDTVRTRFNSKKGQFDKEEQAWNIWKKFTTQPIPDYSTDKRYPVIGDCCTKRIDEVQKENLNPFLYHFETGYDCLCDRNGYLVLTILDGCKPTNTALDYCVHYKLFLDHERGNTYATNHIWGLGIILLYLLCGYPTLNGKADIHCYDTMGIRPKADLQQ